MREEVGTAKGNGRGFLWADGVWRKDQPPSEDDSLWKSYERSNTTAPSELKPKPLERKPVPKTFKHSQRTLLRQAALTLAVQAAPMVYRAGAATGGQIIADAEAIERWIADTPMEKPK